ncbi:DUF2268 domain-containing putative Zn-dependent protease [Clostridium tagluense]|uniref:DUF2268 domain-containing putative Zn-dependent protease n=1 Tax=Clostridium tagluense TaxID=360422 RepID=UPI001C0E1277|nr:DUF2268 domain-containing putative Zn-dependent protease [Clostridium tagluense]MBU3129878.1 DUF2268 domain-containing protein [Clostridium tagluense]
MIVNIRDISNMFCNFWEKAHILNFEEQKLMWKQLYETPNKDIFEHFDCIFKLSNKNYSMDNDLKECFKRYPGHYDNIKVLSNVIERYINKICKKCSEVFIINDLELNFIMMVGQFHANAFVTPFNGTSSFYFLEQMPEERYLDILLAHEITHLFQFSQLCKEEYEPTIAEHIFMDGLACFVSGIICPGFAKAEYLCFNSESEQWLLDCGKYLPNLKTEIISKIESTDYFYFMKYFTGDSEYNSGIPKRIGYALGYDVIAYLNKSYSLDELILWNSDRINKEVKDAILNIL